MKKLIGISILAVLLISATSSRPTSLKTDSFMDGNWELVSFYSYDGVNITDTILPVDGYRQVKMYAHGRVMWTRHAPKDSVEWFGYGTFSADESTLTETLEYASSKMMDIMKNHRTFTFELDYHDDTYSQITLDEDGNRTTSENYKRIR
jgi:hypothetical protein